MKCNQYKCVTWSVSVLFIVITSLVGCSEYVDFSGLSQLNEGGTSGTGVYEPSVAKGPISSSNPLSTGGVQYSIDNADFSFNGQPGSKDQLETGMIVIVDGEVNNTTNLGTAKSIVFTYKLAAVVDEVDLAVKTVTALGHQIRFNEYTSFKNITADTLITGDSIVVSGFTLANGEILATYIEKLETTLSDAIIEGVLTQLDTDNGTFMILEQLVSYPTAQLLNLPGNTLAEGLLVRVTGPEIINNSSVTGTVITATNVEGIESTLTGVPDEVIHVEGLVSQVVTPSSFHINGNAVVIDSKTQYTNGDASGIKINARVFVKGKLNEVGIIIAESVKYILPAEVNIEATVVTVNATNNMLVMMGKTVIVDSFTILIDGSSANIQNFKLSGIAVGDRLKVGGLYDGLIIDAVRIERTNAVADNSQSVLEGIVENSIENPLFRIAGISINTDLLQDFTGFSQSGVTPVSKGTFYASLLPDMVVRASGDYDSGNFTVSHVEIVHCCNWEVFDTNGGFIGGGNDVAFTWDRSLNTDALSNNVNATLSTNTTILNETTIAQDLRIFGPGNYVFDTGADESLSTNFGTANLGGTPLQLSVGPGQIGAHGLFHFGASAPTVCGKFVCNIDVVFIWNVNAVYLGSEFDDSNLGAKNQIFNLSSADGNDDGIPGLPVVDGPFAGFNSTFNLNFTSSP